MENIIPHPNWNGNEKDGFDIALAKLPKKIDDVPLPILSHEDDQILPNLKVWALGFGECDTKVQELESSNILKEAIIIAPKLCPGEVKSYLKPNMLCAFSLKQRVCHGEDILRQSNCFLSMNGLPYVNYHNRLNCRSNSGSCGKWVWPAKSLSIHHNARHFFLFLLQCITDGPMILAYLKHFSNLYSTAKGTQHIVGQSLTKQFSYKIEQRVKVN